MTPDSSRDDLIQLNHEIRQTEVALSIARMRKRRGNQLALCGPALLACSIIFYNIPGVGRHPVAIAVEVITGILGVALAGKAIHYKVAPGGPLIDDDNNDILGPRKSISDIELELALLHDKLKKVVTQDNSDMKTRRMAYKQDAFRDIEHFRQESNSYRKIHNAFQAVLIMGSFLTTAIAGAALLIPGLQWVTIVTSFAVGVSSGFIGYFKYRERSTYLQQTADAIEHELEAVELGIGRYNKKEEEAEKALGEFVEEVHRLKAEQKKRQQNLEQPAEEKTESASSSS